VGTWLTKWEPENELFWKTEGKKRAWKTLIITTWSLVLSFATWFVISAIVVRLPFIGFDFTPMQVFWMAAMPGLAGGTLRIVNTFLIPLFGSRHVITINTWLKIIPMTWLVLAVTNPETPYWQFLVIAFLCGLGGGDFSSFMPSTSLFFPKRLQGLALGIQAGIGNFGVSLVQFVTPWIIGFAAFGTVVGSSQTFRQNGIAKEIWLQNAALWYIPVLFLTGFVCWFGLRSVPVKATFKQQMDIFSNKHTWFCTITYMMTFGSFSGFSATFPLMIKALYGDFDGAPDPLKYAFLGPLIGSLIRALMGALCDRWGGSIFTQISGTGLIVGCLALIFGGYLNPQSLDQFPAFVGLMLWLFFCAGIGNASTFRQYPLVFAHNPRQGAGVIGWTAAIAAYGPFIFSALIGLAITKTGSAAPFFWGAITFYLIAKWINWNYYLRRGAERYDWGTKWGTWCEKVDTKTG